MKIIIDLKYVDTIDKLNKFLQREDINTRINEIISDTTAKGINIINYKGEPIFKIRLKGFKE